MLSERLGLPPPVHRLFAFQTERWDGKAYPGRHRGDDIPLAVRITHVARDAMLQRLIGGVSHATDVVRARGGGAFDPAIATVFADQADELFALADTESAWDETLAAEPEPRWVLEGTSIDAALEAMGDFADLVSPYLVGHSRGVAALAAAAAEGHGFSAADVIAIRRSANVHDIGRVAVSAHAWQKAVTSAGGPRS